MESIRSKCNQIIEKTMKTIQKKELNNKFIVENVRDLNIIEDKMFYYSLIENEFHIVFLNRSNVFFQTLLSFVNSIAEFICIKNDMYLYIISNDSLYNAFTIGLQVEEIIEKLELYQLENVTNGLITFIQNSYDCCGNIKLIHSNSTFYFQSKNYSVLQSIHEYISKFSTEIPISISPIISKNVDIHNHIQSDVFSVRIGIKRKYSNLFLLTLYEFSIDINLQIIFIPLLLCTFKCLIYNEFKYRIITEYKNVNSIKKFPFFSLLDNLVIRDYQYKSIVHITNNNSLKSGIIELPCGSGKTLVGILCIHSISGKTIILCHNNLSCNQWKKEIIKYTNLLDNDINVISSYERKKENNSMIIIMTYQLLSKKIGEFINEKNNQNCSTIKSFYKELQNELFDLIIFDEAHSVVANTFQIIVKNIMANCKIGLSATFVREDHRVNFLDFLIGPKLYSGNWIELIEKGYLAKITCYQINVIMSKEFQTFYMNENNILDGKVDFKVNKVLKKYLCMFDFNKINVIRQLVQYHHNKSDKILIFGQEIIGLITISRFLSDLFIIPVITGDTKEYERLQIIQLFNENKINCIIFGIIGDIGINIPSANVIIQFASEYSNRRQETQRVGRILRPGKESIFYSLISYISENYLTVEYEYAKNRQSFLEQHGIHYSNKTCINGNISTVFSDYHIDNEKNLHYPNEFYFEMINAIIEFIHHQKNNKKLIIDTKK